VGLVTIRHIVLFRLHGGVSHDDPRVTEAVAGSAGLRTTVPGGEDWRIGADTSDREVSADFGGVGDFESPAVLRAFLTHPDHVAAADRWTRIAGWTVCDLEIPSR
jgi:hypothetical protein